MPQSVHQISNPVAGLTIASRSSMVIRGGKNPFVVDFKSKTAEATAVVPSLFIATDCAVAMIE